MRSANLAKLESLSEEQKVQSGNEAKALRDEIHLLDQQHQSLTSINDDYQNSMVGSESVAPQLLAHRRAFVAQLSKKLDALKNETVRQNKLLDGKSRVHQMHTAQTAAIGSMVERERENEQHIDNKREQRQQDDSLFAVRQYNMTEVSDDE